MTGANPEAGLLSTYAFPDELRVDELLLRPPHAGDVDIVQPAFVDPAVGGEAGMPPFSAELLRALLETQLPQLRAAGLLSPYVIHDTRDGRILGGLTLHHLDPMRDVVEVGYWLFWHARGRGVATRALRAAIDHAFANRIYRVEAVVRVGNEPSERVLARLGFVREGVKRRFLRYADARVDSTLFSLLADDA